MCGKMNKEFGEIEYYDFRTQKFHHIDEQIENLLGLDKFGNEKNKELFCQQILPPFF